MRKSFPKFLETVLVLPKEERWALIRDRLAGEAAKQKAGKLTSAQMSHQSPLFALWATSPDGKECLATLSGWKGAKL